MFDIHNNDMTDDDVKRLAETIYRARKEDEENHVPDDT
jgi:hypothetical protein